MSNRPSNLLPFPAREGSATNSKTPAELVPGDWFITRGQAPTGPGSWISWAVEIGPEDHGGAVGLAVKAMPLVAPDGSWPYDHLERATLYWVPLSSVEITMPMPSAGGES